MSKYIPVSLRSSNDFLFYLISFIDLFNQKILFIAQSNTDLHIQGILGSTGLPWVHDRRFALRHLKDLGMGKTQLEVAIHNEARAIVEHLKSFDGKPTKYPKGIRNAVLNVVWQLVVSKRYDLDTDEEVDDINKTVENARAEGSNLVFAEVLFPILKAVPEFLKNHLFKLHLFGNFRKEIKVVTNVRKSHSMNLLDLKFIIYNIRSPFFLFCYLLALIALRSEYELNIFIYL